MLASLLIQVYTGKTWLTEPIYLPPGFLRGKSACEVLEMLVVCSAWDGAGIPQPLCATAPSGGGGGQEILGGAPQNIPLPRGETRPAFELW